MCIQYKRVKKVIDEWDPIGLLSTHAPSDEYDGESEKIFDILQKHENADVSELQQIICAVFSEAFGDDVFKKTPSECAAVAAEIIKK